MIEVLKRSTRISYYSLHMYSPHWNNQEQEQRMQLLIDELIYYNSIVETSTFINLIL